MKALAALLLFAAASPAGGQSPLVDAVLDDGMRHLLNFEFEEARARFRGHIEEDPEDPAGYHYVEKKDEWTHHPRIARPPYLRPTCPNSMSSAYIARGIGKLIDDYDISGVYFDNCAPQLCQNTKHGCGYVDDKGVLQPTLPLMGFRRLFMMVRREFVIRGKEPFILTHAGMYPGSVSFIDVELQGEGTTGAGGLYLP